MTKYTKSVYRKLTFIVKPRRYNRTPVNLIKMKTILNEFIFGNKMFELDKLINIANNNRVCVYYFCFQLLGDTRSIFIGYLYNIEGS